MSIAFCNLTFLVLTVVLLYRRSGNYRVTKFSCLVKHFRGLGYDENFLTVLISTFPGLVIWNETTRQENVKYEQFATFVATMQLLTIYARGKENRRTL